MDANCPTCEKPLIALGNPTDPDAYLCPCCGQMYALQVEPVESAVALAAEEER